MIQGTNSQDKVHNRTPVKSTDASGSPKKEKKKPEEKKPGDGKSSKNTSGDSGNSKKTA